MKIVEFSGLLTLLEFVIVFLIYLSKFDATQD